MQMRRERAQEILVFCNQWHFILLQSYHPLTKLRLCSHRRWEISLNNPFLSSKGKRRREYSEMRNLWIREERDKKNSRTISFCFQSGLPFLFLVFVFFRWRRNKQASAEIAENMVCGEVLCCLRDFFLSRKSDEICQKSFSIKSFKNILVPAQSSLVLR